MAAAARRSFQARAGNGPRGRESGREEGSEGAGFKWSSLAHGSHERGPCTLRRNTHTHTHTGMHANTDGLSCIRTVRLHAGTLSYFNRRHEAGQHEKEVECVKKCGGNREEGKKGLVSFGWTGRLAR